MNEWRELTKLTAGQEFTVERVRLCNTGIAIEGQFEPPALAALGYEDQVFLAAFVRTHGSIKQMERIFGISYPTVKNRLNRIAEKLEYVEVEEISERDSVLDRLERGDISVDEALEIISKGERNE